MAEADGRFKNLLRVAQIESVNFSRQTVTIRLLDRIDARTYECPLPHAAPLGSSGIFSSPSVGTTVIVGFTYREVPLIVAYMPNSAYAQDLNVSSNTANFLSSDVGYPTLEPGEIAVQGLSNSKMLFDKRGNICVKFGDSAVFYDSNDIISSQTDNHYTNTAGHRQVAGIIKRDLRTRVRAVEQVFNKLSDPKFDEVLSNIGRNPNFSTAVKSSGDGANEVLRNPALVEHRELVYEYGRDFQVGSFEQERQRLSDKNIFDLAQTNRRDLSRADVLNLNPTVYNNLMEVIRGTLVDKYGNILDLNRNIQNYDEIDPKAAYERLEREEILLRRSIKYHMEINSRKAPTKEFQFDDIDAVVDGGEKIGATHSRWSIDVDGEGLTKINIPASSNVGNIPLLTRYSNTSVKQGRDEEDIWVGNVADFRDPETPTVDVLHLAFGEASGSGISVPGEYAPANVGNRISQEAISYRTAYHDITTTASTLLDAPPVATSINNAIGDSGANAGGRSLHLNADGSVELNIGRDNIDGKSLVSDLAGGIISRVGKDNNDNSVVAQLDGHIRVHVGGDSIETGEKVEVPSVKFFIEGVDGFDEIEVSADGIFIRSAPNKNIVLDSQKNLVLKSKGDTLLHGENVYIHGTADDQGNGLAGERLVMRSGRKIF